MVRSSTRATLRRLTISSFFFFMLFRVTIAAVAVLAIHKRLRPSASTDCHFNVYLHNYREDLFASCIQSGCYNRSAGQLPYEVFLDCRVARAGDGTTMVVALWEYEVKPGCEESFQFAYSPQGDWARL